MKTHERLLAQAQAQAQAQYAAQQAAQAAQAAQAKWRSQSDTPIKNNEAPQMDLMSQMKMFQQAKGASNQMQQNPQSSNPYQQAQNSRFQQALNPPAVAMPSQNGDVGGVPSGQPFGGSSIGGQVGGGGK